MFCKKYAKIVGVCCLLLLVFTTHAQYVVSGGIGIPLLAKEDTKNRIQVYVLNGVEDAILSYASSSSSHQWYRFKNQALHAEKIPSVQNGTTSTVDRVEEGFGYFVEEAGVLSRYIWIVDYSKHVFDIQHLMVVDDNPCEEIRLKGVPEITKMLYYAPSGELIELDREFEVVYNTLSYSADNKIFSPAKVDTIITNPFKSSLPPPLCDTDFTLTGDQFAKHFKLQKTIKTDLYQAVAVEAHAYEKILTLDGDNLITGGEGGQSAPTTIHFSAYANTPVASFFIWKIYESGKEDNPIIRYTGEEVAYTFTDQNKGYIARLEVSDRTGKCVDSTFVYVFKTAIDEIEIPNVFSPGTSPGINDEFKVAYKSLVGFKGWIFNRWGVQLFHWTDPSKGWDGKKNGKYVPTGVYFYVIEYKGAEGKTRSKSGDINVIIPKNAQ